MEWRDKVNYLVDLLDCTRNQAEKILNAAATEAAEREDIDA